jgi:hypothetical protein
VFPGGKNAELDPNINYYPYTEMDKPLGIQKAENNGFEDMRHKKVVRLSALLTDRLYPPSNNSGTHLFLRLIRPQSRSVARRITSVKKSNPRPSGLQHSASTNCDTACSSSSLWGSKPTIQCPKALAVF